MAGPVSLRIGMEIGFHSGQHLGALSSRYFCSDKSKDDFELGEPFPFKSKFTSPEERILAFKRIRGRSQYG